MYSSSHLFPIHIIYALIFPNIRDPDPRYKWIGKSLTCNKHVIFKALCNKQVGFKALVISNLSFSSFLICCVRRPTPRTDKGGPSITDNMITFIGISVLNFKDILFNQSIVCRKVLFSMYYVIFRWATGGIKFWESAISSITY
jgi:hypothetical protein